MDDKPVGMNRHFRSDILRISQTVNPTRIVFITVLMLSLFTVAKSFIAVSNVDAWYDELRWFLMSDSVADREQRHLIGDYESRLDAIQSQWTVMRWVSLASAVLCGYGIFVVSRREKSIAKRPP